ncbi:hypothetical protein ABZ016_02730 [Streptomyces sp. NPDC006372]|uniref:hypothetical protein n=1 Tax=Streptomyces sp. NPDC006372 TaxID=3155599 RepID=UPI0033B11EDC
MGKPAVAALRVVLLAVDLDGLNAQYARLRTPILVITILGIVSAQVVVIGVVLLLCGVVVAVLVVLVLRVLLAQAVTRDIEAARMRAELEEVI